MFHTCLRLLGLEKSHGVVVNNSPCYCVSAPSSAGRTSTLAWSPWNCAGRNGWLYQVQDGGVRCARSTTTHSHGLSARSRQNVNSAKSRPTCCKNCGTRYVWRLLESARGRNHTESSTTLHVTVYPSPSSTGRTSKLAWSLWSCAGKNGRHYQVQGGGVRGAPLLIVMDCQQDQGKISTRQKGIVQKCPLP